MTPAMRPALALVLTCALVVAAPALADPAGMSRTGQPTNVRIRGENFIVDGFRTAHFGMTPDEVRAAVAKDLPAAILGELTADPVNRTRFFTAAMPALKPGPGPASVTYVFGSASGRLMHVNVEWTLADPSADERKALTASGATVVQGFAGFYWRLLTVARGVPVGPNTLILFTGGGEKGGVVEVRLSGVAYTVQTDKGEVASPAPKGPASLRIAFAQADSAPDAFTLKPGSF